MDSIKFKTVNEYKSVQTPKVRVILEQMRKAIKQAAPEAEELISYNMPAFKYHGILVYYAAHKEHIGFYPANTIVLKLFKDDLVNYETSKGTIKFPYAKALPVNLVKKIVKYRVKDNLERAKAKKKK